MTRPVRIPHREATHNDPAKDVAFSIGRQLKAIQLDVVDGKTALPYIIPASKSDTICLGKNERSAATAIAKIASDSDALAGGVTASFPTQGQPETDLGNAKQKVIFSFDKTEGAQAFPGWLASQLSNANRAGFLSQIREEAELPEPNKAVGNCR